MIKTTNIKKDKKEFEIVSEKYQIALEGKQIVKVDSLKPTAYIQKCKTKEELKVEYITTKDIAVSLAKDKKKLTWQDTKLDVLYYKLPTDEKNENGAFEIEVTLKEKPLTNKIQFKLTGDFNYFYQPPLTKTEVEEGHIRPDDVVGSYAVYHKTKKDNEYGTGKAFHIYRPKIKDSANKEIWGKLNITDNVLTIEIPQSYLDTATYPVSVDPTFGDTGVGTSSIVNPVGINGTKFNLSVDGNVTSLHVRMWANTYPADWRAAIYSDSSGPSVLKVETGSQACVSNWQSQNVSSTFLAAGNYWLLFQNGNGQPSSFSFYYDATGGSGTYDSDYPYGTFPSTYNQEGTTAYIWSIYATYTASPTTSIKKVSGVEHASIKKIGGVAIGSVKKIAGVE